MRLIEIKNLYNYHYFDIYEYLTGTGGCYIDTGIKCNEGDEISVTFSVSIRPTVSNPVIIIAEDDVVITGICLGSAWYKNNISHLNFINKHKSSNAYINYARFDRSNIKASYQIVLNGKINTHLEANGINYPISSTGGGASVIYQLPDANYIIGSSTANGLDTIKLMNVKISNHNFIPCQLVNSIPSYLDGNGIARAAGECGMYDSVSGKFFGNIADSGTFSVEGEVEEGNESKLLQIYAKEINNSNSETETNTEDPEYGGEL